jgi:hypothetical protein
VLDDDLREKTVRAKFLVWRQAMTAPLVFLFFPKPRNPAASKNERASLTGEGQTKGTKTKNHNQRKSIKTRAY